ncbi:MAG: serine/threonine-protein kinase [Phycisphaerales bacterium]|nr:serine/threonine-protein kinase [Phycisphaerales bacterium]
MSDTDPPIPEEEEDATRTLDVGALPRTAAITGTEAGGRMAKVIKERPERAGPFRIEGDAPLGAGGFGAVWLGIRDDGAFTQKVAVKVLSRDSTNDQLVARFELERQVMASIEHPNIARIIDGGTLDDGRPWLAMEFIENGTSITSWCDRRKLSITDRLKLFQKVCDAIEHVHRNGFIHRDIKPDNVLVAANGEPKVLDFGIARIVNVESSAFGQRISETGFTAMTPVYASPEQIRCEPITTVSDVYALGILLYEMLSGHLPFEQVMANRGNLFMAKEESTPEAPSSVVSLTAPETTPMSEIRRPDRVTRTRSTTTGRLRKRLVGDLDCITLKALATEPEDRYASAAELSRDINNHFEGFPIEAAPFRAGYRFGKWLNRNRTLVALAATVAIALTLAGIALAFVAAADAQRARAETAEAITQVESERRAAAEQREAALHDLEQELAEMASANVIGALREAGRIDGAQRILESTLTRIVALRQSAPDNFALQVMEARVRQEMARTFFSRRNPSLEDPEGFLQHWTRSSALADALLQEDASNADALLIAARLMRDRGDLDFYADPPRLDEAQQRYELGMTHLVALKGVEGDPFTIKSEESMLLTKLGDIAQQQGRDEEASQFRRDVLALERALRDEHDAPETRRNLAIALGRVASDALRRERPGEARDYFERSFELRQRIADELPQERRAMRDLANGHEWMGQMLRDRDPDRARAHYAQYFDLIRTLAWMQPMDERAFKDAVTAHGRLLRLYQLHPEKDTADYRRALLDYRQQLFLPRLACLPDDRARWMVLRNTWLLAQVAQDTAQLDMILAQASNVLETLRSSPLDDPTQIRDLVRVHLALARHAAPLQQESHLRAAQAALDSSPDRLKGHRLVKPLQGEIDALSE